jgi:Baseplate J-like protein
MSTSVPAIQFTPQGVILPTEAAILTGVQADQVAAFGGGLGPALATPQGQLASSTTAIIAEKNSEIAFIANQVDPQFASGAFQDAIARIYFLTRKPATATAVTCTLGGLPTSVIPAGSFAQDTSGNTYVLLANATIGSGSTVSAQFQNILTGPIPCPAGTLTKVFQQVDGWDTITNPADGALGQNVESRAEFEFRRQNSVALNGNGTVDAILANVFQVPNVLDCFVIDNPGPATNANPLPGGTSNPTNFALTNNSVYVAVVGGVAASVAQAIWDKKDVGCSYNGNTTVTVQDQAGYSFPFPSYSVTFNVPTVLPILFAVQIVNAPNLPSNITALIQAAIVAQFNGENDNLRARIGSIVLAAQYYACVAAVSPTVQLVSILVGTTAATLTQVAVGIDQSPSISTGNISVALVSG